ERSPGASPAGPSLVVASGVAPVGVASSAVVPAAPLRTASTVADRSFDRERAGAPGAARGAPRGPGPVPPAVGSATGQRPNMASHSASVLGLNTKFIRRVSPIVAEGSAE